jgi:hypothetical protein
MHAQEPLARLRALCAQNQIKLKGTKIMERNRVKPELAATIGQWEYVCCECIVNLGCGVRAIITRDCAACGNNNLRFYHTLEHLEDHRLIEVGIECARVLMQGSEIPPLAENETKRKEGWRIYYRRPGRCTTTIDNLIERGKL